MKSMAGLMWAMLARMALTANVGRLLAGTLTAYYGRLARVVGSYLR